MVWTVRKERRKRSREESESDAPRHGARKSLRYEGSQQETVARKSRQEGSQQETVGGGAGPSKGCQSAPSPAPRPLPAAAAPSPPPAPTANLKTKGSNNLAGNAVIRALQQQQVVGTEAAADAGSPAGPPAGHAEVSPTGLALPLLGGDTFGGLTNLFAGDSLFGVPLEPSPPAKEAPEAGKERARGPVRKASHAAIEAFLGTVTT